MLFLLSQWQTKEYIYYRWGGGGGGDMSIFEYFFHGEYSKMNFSKIAQKVLNI